MKFTTFITTYIDLTTNSPDILRPKVTKILRMDPKKFFTAAHKISK
jgi:hypothetical protein